MSSRRRIVVAGVLSLLVPGAGHAYLRAWIRAVAWFSIAVATAALVVPEATQGTLQAGSLESVIQQSINMPAQVHVAVFVISVLSAIDTTILVVRADRRTATLEGEAGTCPNCGGDLDKDIAFCPWCSTRLDHESDENQNDAAS